MTSLDSTIRRAHDLLEGEVLVPGDDGFDDATTPFYTGVERTPAAVLRVRPQDVPAAVRLAAEAGVELAVKSGGHSPAGYSQTEGGFLLDLSLLDTLDIDTKERTAWAGTGLTAGRYVTATNELGLTTGFGDTASVGIGGITLAGGIGLLARKHGLTIDSVIGAEVVTADGSVLLVDAESHPDLFWALRGGGGNFGVVTRFKYRLHPVDRIVGGMLALPATPEVIAGFVATAAEARRELTTIANVMVAPPLPFLPEELAGRPIVMGVVAWAGDLVEGKEVVDELRGVAEPLADMVGDIPYPQLFEGEEPDFHPRAVGHNFFSDSFDEGDGRAILDAFEDSTAMVRVTQIRALGGSIGEVADDATAFAHRHRPYMVNTAAMFVDLAETGTHQAWADSLAARLLHGPDAAYIGFQGDEGIAGLSRAYPQGTLSRLRAVKRAYDPENLFRRNLNIPPSA